VEHMNVGTLLKMAGDVDFTKALTEVVLSSFVGVVGWFVGRSFERRKARKETALKACKQLRVELSAWYTAIKNSVMMATNTNRALDRLEIIRTDLTLAHHVRTCVEEMSNVKECRILVDKVPKFSKSVNETKSEIKVRLLDIKDFNKDKQVIIDRIAELLLGNYNELDDEIGRVIKLLG
jgi:hypothetical protein